MGVHYEESIAYSNIKNTTIYVYILVQSVPESDLERIYPPGREAFDRPFPEGFKPYREGRFFWDR